MRDVNVLMLGPARNVKGGMTSVVDNYFKYGLDKMVNLKYIETVNDKNFFSKLLKMLRGYIEFKKNVKNYDIVHIHMASRMSTFRKGQYVRISKKYKKKVILHIHGAEFKIFLKNCNSKMKKYVIDTFNMADKIIVLSEEWKEFFSKYVSDDKIVVIYNSIVMPENFEKDVDTNKILFLGRLGKRKGVYDLVNVVEKLLSEFPNIELYIGGDGEIEEVRKIIKDKNIEEKVHLLGWVREQEKEKYLKECSFYILPSYNEGMPMSLIEGMAYKNVSISTNVGGIPKVITNEENGIIIEPGDLEKLGNNLKKLLLDKDMRIKLSENARKSVEVKFNIEKNIKKLMEVFNILV